MGIKGIYKEIGPGQRVSLAKLAISHLEQTGRPFRLAIDVSIWQFQAQAARGGVNPAIRTLFYRLLRLLSLHIQPIFVFDGPNKPAFKRNKRSGRGDGLSSAMTKRLLNLFGCLAHDAPGEAEAECALLQREGLVDAVLSEDVDTIMFGCTKTLRNWSSESSKGSKTPTHISVYDIDKILDLAPGLDREGMVLVALMSGGDYIPEGIPGAGIKLACEAARAGFGTSLCKLKRADTSALASWKEWLIYELRTNESGFFRVRHKALAIPDEFPNFDILRYYTHPVVSPRSVLDSLRQLEWQKPINVPGLREFARETFDWDYRGGAVKFIRVLAPVMLVQKLMDRNAKQDEQADQVEVLERQEQQLVKAIFSRREHFSTDATPELRISYIPTDIVGHSFEQEPEEVIETARDGLALNSDDDVDADDGELEAGAKSGVKKPFSPTDPELVWVPETIAKLGIPVTVEDWEAAQRAKISRKAQKAKAPTSRARKTQAPSTAKGSLDKFVRVTKSLPKEVDISKDLPVMPTSTQSAILRNLATETHTAFTPSGARLSKSTLPPPATQLSQTSSRPGRTSKQSKPETRRNAPPKGPKLDASTNPWTIAGSQVSPRIARTTAAVDPILISSSPPASPCAASPAPVSRVENYGIEPPYSSITTSPRKRRSGTPLSDLQKKSSKVCDAAQQASPTPQPQCRPARKLARTESMPTSPQQRIDTAKPGTRRGLERAHTVAVDIVELEDSDDEYDDFDLPPIESILGRIPGSSSATTTTTATATATAIEKPVSAASSPRRQLFSSQISSSGSSKRTTKTTTATSIPSSSPTVPGKQQRQMTFDASFGSPSPVRMTKMYVPSRRTPGFYKEVDVTVDEAEAFKEAQQSFLGGAAGGQRREKAWRRSDVSCVDLTGEP